MRKKGHLDEKDFLTVMVVFSITAMFKVPSQKLRGTLTTVF